MLAYVDPIFRDPVFPCAVCAAQGVLGTTTRLVAPIDSMRSPSPTVYMEGDAHHSHDSRKKRTAVRCSKGHYFGVEFYVPCSECRWQAGERQYTELSRGALLRLVQEVVEATDGQEIEIPRGLFDGIRCLECSSQQLRVVFGVEQTTGGSPFGGAHIVEGKIHNHDSNRYSATLQCEDGHRTSVRVYPKCPECDFQIEKSTCTLEATNG